MGRDSAGVNWKLDQNVVAQTFGSYSGNTLSTNTTAQVGYLTSGWAQYSTIQIQASSASTLNAGDTFQIAGLYATNPQNRQAYGSGKLRNFVVQSTTTVGTGATNITVSPAIIIGGQFQNTIVIGSTSTTAVVTPFNNTGTLSPQNIMMHRNAFTLAVNDCGYLQAA
jgi:hypothetical protein